MKRILGNFWTQLFLGLITGIIGTVNLYLLAVGFYIKYAGLCLLLMCSDGDKSPLTFTIATVFTVLTFTFPTLVWLWLNKFGKLKTVSKKIRIITFFLFATLPLWIYLGWGAFSKLQAAYKDYKLVRDTCVVQNGVNKTTVDENTKEFECKNGVFNGFAKTYNSKGILIYEGVYLDGKLNGTENIYYDNGKIKITSNYKTGKKEGAESFYNEDGSTSLYIINEKGKSNQVYFQRSEKDISSEISLKSQNFFCKNEEKYLSENFNYSCFDNVINGEFVKYDTKGNILLKVKIANGVLDGIYEQFSDGKLYRHLEFKTGNLDGKVYELFSDGKLEYEGQYTNGLQYGIFRRYDYKGNIESEVLFENGKIIFPQIDTR